MAGYNPRMDEVKNTLNELNELEKEVQKIFFVDKEKYLDFKKRIEMTKSVLSDEKQFSRALEMIMHLRMDIYIYKNGSGKGKKSTISEIAIEEKSVVRDNETQREHMQRRRVESFIEAGRKSYEREVDLEYVKKLKELWKKEQTRTEYNSSEVNSVEEAFANMILAYQIGYLKENKVMPEIAIEDFCEPSSYEHELRDRIFEQMATKQVSAETEQIIELTLLNANLEELLHSEDVWSLLAGEKIEREALGKVDEEVEKVPEIVEEKSEPVQEEISTDLDIIDTSIAERGKSKKLNLVLVTEKKDSSGKSVKKYKKVKIGERGIFSIPKKLREQAVEAIIPDDVEVIGAEAFKGCKNLRSVKFDKKFSKLRTICDGAFCGCKNLTSIELPDQLTSIGSRAFSKTGLSQVTIPDNVTRIGTKAFEKCTNLRSVKFSKAKSKLQLIGDEAFSHCTSLDSIELPDELEYIGVNAFLVTGLRKVVIPYGVGDVDKRPLENISEYGPDIEAEWAFERSLENIDIQRDRVYNVEPAQEKTNEERTSREH